MKNADVKSALQKKSPGQRPGHSSLQGEVYQIYTALVKGQLQYWPAPAMGAPDLPHLQRSFTTAAACPIPIYFSTSYIYYRN
jgi:hypothetical protein